MGENQIHKNTRNTLHLYRKEIDTLITGTRRGKTPILFKLLKETLQVYV